MSLAPPIHPSPIWNFENTTLGARQREHFRIALAIFLVAQLSPKRGVLVHENSLASCQRCRHSVEPRALTYPFKHSDLIAWSLLSWHPLWQILSSTLMGPTPSFSHNVYLRLGLVISGSQIIILPTRLSPLTSAPQPAHFSLPVTLSLPSIFLTVSYDPALTWNITSSLSLYLSCTEVCFRNAHSCHTIKSLKSHTQLTQSPSAWSTQTHMRKVSHPVTQSLLVMVDIATTIMGPDTQTSWLPSTCAGCLKEVLSHSTIPCTTLTNAWLHILTCKSLYWSCHFTVGWSMRYVIHEFAYVSCSNWYCGIVTVIISSSEAG